jgi:hypothetical protein
MNNLTWKAAATTLVVLAFAILVLRAGKPRSAIAASLPSVSVAPPPASTNANAPQFGDSQCVSTVPRSWGQYRGGSSQAGLAFEASDGTLRFVTNLPCGATPIIALEVRRTPAAGGNSVN